MFAPSSLMGMMCILSATIIRAVRRKKYIFHPVRKKDERLYQMIAIIFVSDSLTSTQELSCIRIKICLLGHSFRQYVE
jgi:hypothetical protein